MQFAVSSRRPEQRRRRIYSERTQHMMLSLKALAGSYAFESSPSRTDLGVLHVLFDKLTGGDRTHFGSLSSVSLVIH